MKPAENQLGMDPVEKLLGTDLILFQCGAVLPMDKYSTLLQMVRESMQRESQGKARTSLSAYRNATGYHGKYLEFLVSGIRRYNEQVLEKNSKVQEEADKAYRAPSPGVWPQQRRANGAIHHPLPDEEMGCIGGVRVAA